MSLDIPSDIDIIPGEGFEWIRIMVSSLSPTESTFIRISARGKVVSIRQDGREVLPTRFSDLLGADPATRGLYGGVGLLLLATWTVLFKRATDVLAKNILPE